MSNPVAILKHAVDKDGNDLGDSLWFWCPGCDTAHSVNVRLRDPLWTWNGDLERVTISPSILCYSSVHLCERDHYAVNECPDYQACDRKGHSVTWDDGGDPDNDPPDHYWHGEPHTKDPAWGNCHSFLVDGVWQFLGDSAHALAGQNVPMVPLPDWLAAP